MKHSIPTAKRPTFWKAWASPMSTEEVWTRIHDSEVARKKARKSASASRKANTAYSNALKAKRARKARLAKSRRERSRQ